MAKLIERKDLFHYTDFKGNPTGLVNHAIRNGRNVTEATGSSDQGYDEFRRTLALGEGIGIDTAPAPRQVSPSYLGATAVTEQVSRQHNRQGEQA